MPPLEIPVVPKGTEIVKTRQVKLQNMLSKLEFFI